MKKVKLLCLWFCILVLLYSSFSNDKIVVKNIENDNISIKWYLYSYITNFSPYFIDVRKGDSIVRIYETVGGVTDVLIDKNKIKIKVFNLKNTIVYTKKLRKDVFGYKIELDTTSTLYEYEHIPEAVKDDFYIDVIDDISLIF